MVTPGIELKDNRLFLLRNFRRSENFSIGLGGIGINLHITISSRSHTQLNPHFDRINNFIIFHVLILQKLRDTIPRKKISQWYTFVKINFRSSFSEKSNKKLSLLITYYTWIVAQKQNMSSIAYEKRKIPIWFIRTQKKLFFLLSFCIIRRIFKTNETYH
jgi:hypothetical protein